MQPEGTDFPVLSARLCHESGKRVLAVRKQIESARAQQIIRAAGWPVPISAPACPAHHFLGGTQRGQTRFI
jgi:hypothetical protein